MLVLSHLSLLTTQTHERATKRIPDIKSGILQANAYPDPGCKAIISTMQSSRVDSKIQKLKDRLIYPVGLIIIDEAHYMTCESYETIMNYFPNVPVVGCTATPFKSSHLMTNHFDIISYSLSLQELIDQGHLVPPRLIQSIKKEDTAEGIVGQVIRIYKDNDIGKKAVIYLQTIEDAKFAATSFKEAGINARAVTSELVGTYRDEILKDFNDGSIDVLTTVNVLSAGFDAPKVSSIYMPYATKSCTQYMQRIGRGLRLCPEIGKKECSVYVFGDAPSVHNGLYNKLQNHVLNKGGAIKEYNNYKQDLEMNDFDKSSEVYKFTEMVVQAIKHMERIGFGGMATMLNNKEFPKRFLKDIAGMITKLPKTKTKLHEYNKITDKQAYVLGEYGFINVGQLSRFEASTLISMVMNKTDAAGVEKYILQSGKFKGRHINELSDRYKDIVRDKFPGSGIAKLINEYEKERKYG